MPLTTLTINAQENHCVRHSKGSYQSREISHTDIHSHARTHIRYCMHCFWKFWSHNMSIFSSTSWNRQPCLAPHGIIQGHLKKEKKKNKMIHYRNPVFETEGLILFLLTSSWHHCNSIDFNEVTLDLLYSKWEENQIFSQFLKKAFSKWKQTLKAKAGLQLVKHIYARTAHIHQKTCSQQLVIPLAIDQQHERTATIIQNDP